MFPAHFIIAEPICTLRTHRGIDQDVEEKTSLQTVVAAKEIRGYTRAAAVLEELDGSRKWCQMAAKSFLCGKDVSAFVPTATAKFVFFLLEKSVVASQKIKTHMKLCSLYYTSPVTFVILYNVIFIEGVENEPEN